MLTPKLNDTYPFILEVGYRFVKLLARKPGNVPPQKARRKSTKELLTTSNPFFQKRGTQAPPLPKGRLGGVDNSFPSGFK